MGALAILKDEGYGAYGAMAQLATALHFFYSPTEKARKALQHLGLDATSLASDLRQPRGLATALLDLKTHLDAIAPGDEVKQMDILGHILPGGRGRVLLTLMNQLDRYNMKISQINRTTGNFNSAVSQTQKTAAFQLHTAWSQLTDDLIKLGDNFRNNGVDAVKLLIGVLRVLIHFIAFLIHNLNTLLPIIVTITAAWVAYRLAAIAAAIATGAIATARTVILFIQLARSVGILTAAMIALQVSTIPISAVFIAIAAVIGLATYLIIKHWGAVKHALKVALHAIVVAFTAVKNAGVDAFHWVINAANNAGDWIRTSFKKVGHFIVFPFLWARDRLRAIFNWIFSRLSAVVNFAKSIPSRVWHGIKSIPGQALNVVKGLLPHFASGVNNFVGGAAVVGERGPELAFLPQGTSVAPHTMTPSAVIALAGGSPGSMNVPRSSQEGGGPAGYGKDAGYIELHSHVWIDGKEVTEIVSKHMANKKARR
jgi:hypothetical protein